MQNKIRRSGLHSSFCIHHSASRKRAFTLVELLTVLIIITILVGILIPTVSHVRQRAYNAGVQAQIAALRQAIEQYYADFNAYPGPIANVEIGTTDAGNPVVMDPSYTAGWVPAQFQNPTTWLKSITMPENLTLGLMGGLHLVTPAGGSPEVTYNPTLVAQGPQVLNSALPKKFGAYIDNGDLSDSFKSTGNGLYSDAVVLLNNGIAVNDSPIPEILDRFPSRMPILYLRANVGATMYLKGGAYPATLSDQQNPVVIDGTDFLYVTGTGQGGLAQPVIRYAQYDISQIKAYTKGALNAPHTAIGEGKTMPTYVGWGSPPTGPNGSQYPFHGLQSVGSTAVLSANNVGTGQTYQYPYPAYPYFTDPNSPGYNSANGAVTLPYARAKDSYILISAGVDRIYGTADDITSFGDVRP